MAAHTSADPGISFERRKAVFLRNVQGIGGDSNAYAFSSGGIRVDGAMISDSPYQAGEFVLSPGMGIIAGLIGSGLMLAALELTSPTEAAFRDWLPRLAGLVPGSSLYSRFQLELVGGTVHAALGAALGLLFAVCLQRIPWYAMIAVGVFYGVLLWVVGGLSARIFFTEHVQGLVRSAAYLRACIVYGLVLAGIAVSTSLNQKPGPSLPKD